MGVNQKAHVAMIGCGGMAREHVRKMLRQQDTTEVVVVCDPSSEAYDLMAKVFVDNNLPAPPNQPDLEQLLQEYAGIIDVAFIVTPHASHYEQAKACLDGGLDVLLEKPMVVTADEAKRLIEARDRSGKLLVIAFNGSLSPQIRKASAMVRAGELGELRMITASIWEGWKDAYRGHWKQNPNISGGGFMFDTGAHMMNTVADLANDEFVDVAAWLDNRGLEIDILGCVIGRLRSGVLVTLSSCGETLSIGSDVRIYCTNGIIRTGAWGEELFVQRAQATGLGQNLFEPIPVPASQGTWEQFIAVRSGKIENPSPPEIGLRMAKLWDAIRASAAQNGVPVRVQ
ncbi:MAG: Gfo/Idh/MocA family oxidoreductase [Anaerolineae bacterium]